MNPDLRPVEFIPNAPDVEMASPFLPGCFLLNRTINIKHGIYCCSAGWLTET